MLVDAPTQVATNAGSHTSAASASTSVEAPAISTSISISSATPAPSASIPLPVSNVAVPSAASKYAARAKLRRKIRRHRRRSSSYRKSPTEKDLEQLHYPVQESDSSDSDEEDHGHSRGWCGRWLPLKFTTAEWWQRFALLAVILGFVYLSAWLLIDSGSESDSSASSPFSSPFSSRTDGAEAPPPTPVDIWASPGHFVPFARAVKENNFAVQGAMIRGQPMVVGMANVQPPSPLPEQPKTSPSSPSSQAAPAAQLVLNQQRDLVNIPQDDDGLENPQARRRPFKGLLDSNVNPNFRRQTHGAGGWGNGQEQRRPRQTGTRSASSQQRMEVRAFLAEAAKP